jgi:MFS transporter, putative metabolite:H+ symporter
VSAVRFHHPVAFVTGVLLLTAGVLMHLPDFLSMQSMGYQMVGMPMSPVMLSGMAAILLGLALSTHGLLPRWSLLRAPRASTATRYYTRAMDDAPLRWAHWWLLFVLGVALVIDVMKPATLGFILPGLRAEYGISTREAAVLPLVALTGTTIGSLLWGFLADRIGRRASILLAAMFFLGTSICGFMPSFAWNLFMCFVMGLSAGGMLPIVYALMAETVPARMRGWLVILHGGLATALGYLAASGLATLLEPLYSWRILWFFGLPTGLLIVVLNRWIPESPRFLLERGDEEGARDVMRRFGIDLSVGLDTAIAHHLPHNPGTASKNTPGAARALRALFGQGLRRHTVAVMLYGLGWGLVNWGFVTFLPTILRDSGFQSSASALLFYAALASVPGTVLVAYLYGRWSSRNSMVAFALLTAASLSAFAVFGNSLASQAPVVVVALTAVLMLSSTAVISMLSPYAAEVYPTELRGSGSGLAAASSKVGGMIGPPVIGALLTSSGGLFLPAMITAVPIAVAAIVLIFLGEETRERGLEHISGA